ncbi:Asp-tRNA(Asn)/Glu-tRNA(Gln) amidotransferase subunit GatB [Emticicia sp. 21SJ11W-3]|uniref:Asp-tRNA(Asn)/Glu-tRNA(Gln) amidotransferase subunit GatB n=1 Tax=Emticicia sp. 21SJ11W-3 TaxID=2916755 RepID=UPI0020A0101E|nr:Asp-tRNA(Asn)/Glu-tRNA(Gln) amidotransferase subunit GatB [Emticicia sp. 21SJ11W-3]UTA67749.1 Asp-tRNA(Asn)/Glu-tRNA(Gln) amidotransferase subunit GatB [Emticicia sp. 21SJ11W-3]
MQYEIVIGLEVHCQLSTESKIFASDSNRFGSEPNTNISVITLGHPGVLPKLNKKAVEYAIRMGLACGCEITRNNYFDRKNYFYPDLPKGYQVSQDKFPICKGGGVTVRLKDGKQYKERFLELHHIHLEEDAGKSVHEGDSEYTRLDYNRAGTPLIEIVSEPCMKSAEEAGAYLTEIRKMVRYLDICDGNMEEGSMRADLNISIRPVGTEKLGTKVEVKNMNSIRNLQRAVEFEFKRQVRMLETGETIIQETRMFDADTGETYGMRVKETMNDYRYFPEPDLAPIHISDAWLNTVKNQMPALPHQLFKQFTQEYGLPDEHAAVLTDNKDTAGYFLETARFTKNHRAIANWLTSTIKGYLNDKGIEINQLVLKPTQLAELIALVDDNKISSSTAAQKLFPLLLDNPAETALALAEANNLIQQSNTDTLQALINEVLSAYPDKVKEFKSGKKGLLGMFVGEVMKKSKGTADPKLTNQLLMDALK